MKDEIRIKFNSLAYQNTKRDAIAHIQSKVAQTLFNEGDFDINFDDVGSSITFNNAELVYFADMQIISAYVSVSGRKVDRGYQPKGKKHTISIDLDALTIVSINGLKLRDALKKLSN